MNRTSFALVAISIISACGSLTDGKKEKGQGASSPSADQQTEENAVSKSSQVAVETVPEGKALNEPFSIQSTKTVPLDVASATSFGSGKLPPLSHAVMLSIKDNLSTLIATDANGISSSISVPCYEEAPVATTGFLYQFANFDRANEIYTLALFSSSFSKDGVDQRFYVICRGTFNGGWTKTVIALENIKAIPQFVIAKDRVDILESIREAQLSTVRRISVDANGKVSPTLLAHLPLAELKAYASVSESYALASDKIFLAVHSMEQSNFERNQPKLERKLVITKIDLELQVVTSKIVTAPCEVSALLTPVRMDSGDTIVAAGTCRKESDAEFFSVNMEGKVNKIPLDFMHTVRSLVVDGRVTHLLVNRSNTILKFVALAADSSLKISEVRLPPSGDNAGRITDCNSFSLVNRVACRSGSYVGDALDPNQSRIWTFSEGSVQKTYPLNAYLKKIILD